MLQKWRTFSSAHAWRYALKGKRFFVYWLSVFAVIWTFTEFASYFFIGDDASSKPNVWLVLGCGLVIAVWLSRPRLRRSIHLADKDVTIRIEVNDMFALRDGSWIIPSNRAFLHEHIDEDAVVIQFRNRFFASKLHFEEAIENALPHDTAEYDTIQGRTVKKYPLGTVLPIPLPGKGKGTAYVLASADLNEHGRGEPNVEHLQSALASLWSYIGKQGNTGPFIIPVIGSGRQRITHNRLQLSSLIVKTFLSEIDHRKFTRRLTIVIHPRAYLQNKYDLDDIEMYLACMDKFEIQV